MAHASHKINHKIRVTEASDANLIGSGEVILTPEDGRLIVQVKINGHPLDLSNVKDFKQVSPKRSYKDWIGPVGLSVASFVVPPLVIGSVITEATRLSGLAAVFAYTALVVPPYTAGYAACHLLTNKSRWLIEVSTGGYLKVEGPAGILSFLAGVHTAPTVEVETTPAATAPTPAPA